MAVAGGGGGVVVFADIDTTCQSNKQVRGDKKRMEARNRNRNAAAASYNGGGILCIIIITHHTHHTHTQKGVRRHFPLGLTPKAGGSFITTNSLYFYLQLLSLALSFVPSLVTENCPWQVKAG